MLSKVNGFLDKLKKRLAINRKLKMYNVSDDCSRSSYDKLESINDEDLIVETIKKIKPKKYNYYIKEFVLSFIFLLYNIISVTFFNKIVFDRSILVYFIILILFILIPFCVLIKEIKDKKMDFNVTLVCMVMVFSNILNLLIVGTKFQMISANFNEAVLYELDILPVTVKFYKGMDLVGTSANINFIFSILLFAFSIYLLFIGKNKDYDVNRYNNTYSYTLFVSTLLVLISLFTIFTRKALDLLTPLFIFVIIYDIVSIKRRNLVDLFVLFCMSAMEFYIFINAINALGMGGYHLEYKNIFIFVEQWTWYNDENIIVRNQYKCDFSSLFAFLSFFVSLATYIYKKEQIKKDYMKLNV